MIEMAIIGAGRMGYAIAASWVRNHVILPRQLILADPLRSARRRAAALGCRVTPDPAAAARIARSVLLAVKPQVISHTAGRMGREVRGKRVISILAGTTRRRLARLLPGARIIRAMPNTPLLVGAGAIVLSTDGTSPADLRFASRLFASMGRVFLVPERRMNVVTALSGSGPALYCAFLESLSGAAKRAGLPADLSESLAVQTLAGTGQLLRIGPRLSPRRLREMVTSPGGTTEAALAIFKRRRLGEVAREAIRAAVRRGIQLSH